MTQNVDITAVERALIAEIGAAKDLAAIERVRIAALGKKGRVPELMAGSALFRPSSARPSDNRSMASKPGSATR